MPISPSLYEEGTVTLEDGNVTVLGDGTAWIVNGVAGGIFARAGIAVPIRAVGADGELTLAYGWPGSSESGVPYYIARESALAADAIFVHNSLVKVIRDLSLSALMPDGSGTLAERNALSPVPAVGYIWLRVEVGYPLELYRKETSGWSGPYDLSGPEGPRGEAATLPSTAPRRSSQERAPTSPIAAQPVLHCLTSSFRKARRVTRVTLAPRGRPGLVKVDTE